MTKAENDGPDLKNMTPRMKEFLRWFYGRDEVQHVPIQNRILARWWVSRFAARENLVALNHRGLIRVAGGYIYPVESVKEQLFSEDEGRNAGGSRGCPRCGYTEGKSPKRSSVIDKAFKSPFKDEES